MNIIMRPLTKKMVKFLCKLHEVSNGIVGEYHAVKGHWKVIEELHNRKLIIRDAQYEGKKLVRYSALTELGEQWSCENMELVINDNVVTTERPQKCVSLFFEMDKDKYPHHVTAYKHVGKLKAERNFRPTMIDLLNIDEQLDNGDTSLLEEMYPEAMDALKAKIRREVEAEALNKVLARLDSMSNPPQSHETPPASIGIKGAGLSSGNVGLKGNTGLSGGLGQAMSAPPPMFDDDLDDDDFVLDIKKDTGTNANQNLINAMKSLSSL